MMTDTGKPEALTLEQAAARLGVSVATVRDWISKGRLRTGKMTIYGRSRIVVRTADVEKLATERQKGSEVEWQQ